MVLTVETGKKRMPNRDKSFKLLLSCAASLLSYAFWMWKDCFSKGQLSECGVRCGSRRTNWMMFCILLWELSDRSRIEWKSSFL